MAAHRLVIPLAAVVLALAGCAAGKPVPGTPEARSTPAAWAAYGECLKEQGIDAGATAASDDALVAADERCRRLGPDGGSAAPPSAAELAEARVFARCMRANGMPDYPDPAAGGGPAYVPPTAGPELDRLTTAAEVCAARVEASAAPSRSTG